MSAHVVPLPRPLATDAPFSARRGVLILLSAAQFMVAVDVTVVNLALPSIGAALGLAAGDLPWVMTAYALMAGALLLLGGRLADLFGARRTFLTGLGLFTAASLAAGLAESGDLLIGARAAQGVGAALLSPGALAVLVRSFTGAERTKALAVWGAVGAGGAAIGVLLGGALTTWASWRWAFLINVPVGALAAGLALRWIPADAARRRGALDLPGATAVTGGLLALVYALQSAPQAGWAGTQTLGLLAVAAAALVAFVAIERRAAQPLLPAGLFRGGSLSPGSAAMFGATALLIGVFYFGSLYMQSVLGMDPLEAGLGFLPVAVTIAVASHVGSHLLQALGSRLTVVIGLTLAGVGNLLLSGVEAGGSYAGDLLPGMLVASAGLGLVFVTASVTAMHGVTEHHAGVASGLMTTAHELGAALGVATLAAIALSSAGASGLESDGLADGFGRAYLVAGVAGLIAAAATLRAFPVIRPDGAQRVSMH